MWNAGTNLHRVQSKLMRTAGGIPRENRKEQLAEETGKNNQIEGMNRY